MRVVFAGTPEVGAAGARGGRRQPRTSWSASSPAPTRRPAAAAGWSPSPVAAARPRSSAYPCSSPSTRATRSSRPRCAALRARLLPGGRLRRAAAAVGARHPARTAGSTCTSRCCPPGAARRPVQHAIWAGDEVTGATTFRIVKELDAGPTYGVMTERIRPDRHRRRPARRGSPRAAPGCWCATLDGIEDGTLEAREQPADGRQPRAQDHRRRRRASTGPSRPSPSTGGSGPARPRPAPGRRTTASGSSSARCAPTPTAPLAPGELEVGKNAVLVGTGSRAVRLGDVQAVRQEADAGRRLGPRRPARVRGRLG